MSELTEKMKSQLAYAREMEEINRRQWRRTMYRVFAKTAAVVVGVTVVSRALSAGSENTPEESD